MECQDLGALQRGHADYIMANYLRVLFMHFSFKKSYLTYLKRVFNNMIILNLITKYKN
jgi:hypothetical protein